MSYVFAIEAVQHSIPKKHVKIHKVTLYLIIIINCSHENMIISKGEEE